MALPDDFDARLRELHSQGISAHRIAKQLGCSASTVSRHAAALNLSFERRGTAAAVAAHQVDLRARRQAVMVRMMARVETNLDRLEDDGYTYSLVLPGSAETGARIVDQTDVAPPSADERNHMHVITGYMSTIARLEQVDGQPGVTKVASIITRVAEAFGVSDA